MFDERKEIYMNNICKFIVYFGIIQYESENAMCQRAEGIKRLISAIGYTPIIIGVSAHVRSGEWRKKSNLIYEINLPNSTSEWIKSCVSSCSIKEVMCDIGIDNISALIMADYRFLPMKQMKTFCLKNDITFVVDIMDWFVSGKSLNSKIKNFDNVLRMKKLYPNVDRKIYICSRYIQLLGMSEHTAIIPGIVDEGSAQDTRVISESKRDRIVLSFAGVPGVNCNKEKIDWVIKTISIGEWSNLFEFHIAGVSKQEFLEDNPDMGQYISDNIIFYGRIKHDDCVELLQRSDFGVVIRPNNRLSNYGFSTKIGEAFANQIPILATDTSDNKKYVIEGKTGYVCDCTFESVKEMLDRVAQLSREEIEELKDNIRRHNPLTFLRFVEEFRKVIE